MPEQVSLSEYKDGIKNRLLMLFQLDIPRYRSYRKPDGTWVDREVAPEYMEREALCRIWREITDYENWFQSHSNPLLVSLRLQLLVNSLLDEPEPIDIRLQSRIAQSVYTNAPVF